MPFIRLFLALLLIFIPVGSVCAAAKEGTLPLPRFVSIKAPEANIRTGPGIRYPILWVFVKKGEPVEVITEFEQWRKIRDKQGDQGWIHESMLSGRRHIIVSGDKPQALYREADTTSALVLQAEPEVRGELLSCAKAWCQVKIAGEKGWMEKAVLWGVYLGEVSK